MSYVLEFSGVVSYTDNTEKSFLAVDDIKDDIVLQDQQAFADVGRVFRILAIEAGGELALPRTIPQSGKTVKNTNAKINCWYTIGEESFEFSIIESDTTGLTTIGDGNIAQFMSNYGNGANSFVNRIYKGATLYGTKFTNPALVFIRNDVFAPAQHIVGFYSQVNPTLEFMLEKIIDPSNEAAIIINRDGLVAPFVHARIVGNPPPQPIDINTQVNFTSIAQVDLTINSVQNFSLTNGVLA